MFFPIHASPFVAGNLGREWPTDITHEEKVRVLKDCGCIPQYNIMVYEYFKEDHPLAFKYNLIYEDSNKRITEAVVNTPYGEMSIQTAECKYQSVSPFKGPVKEEDDFKKFLWYIREVRKNAGDIEEAVKSKRKALGDDTVLFVLIPQPFELYHIFAREEAIYHEIDYPEMFEELLHEVEKETLKILHEIEGYRHIISSSCETVYGTQMKNLQAMSEAVEKYNNSFGV